MYNLTVVPEQGDNVVHDKNIQNGGHKQCEGYVTLKEKFS